MSKRYVLLGASRGLGFSLYKYLWQKESRAEFFLASRTIAKSPHFATRTKIFSHDFSKLPIQNEFLTNVFLFKPTHVVYLAGGGPYGAFANKKWSDHAWALNVSFLAPAEILHVLMTAAQNDVDELKSLASVTLIGSEIAEALPDPFAASYASAKHALRGLVKTVQAENFLPFQIKLFSPGYMLTDMLPPNATPRRENRAESPDKVAQRLAAFIDSDELLG